MVSSLAMQCLHCQTRPVSSAAGVLAAAPPQPCQPLALPRTRRRGERVQTRAVGDGPSGSSINGPNGLQASGGKPGSSNRPPPQQQPVQPANGQAQRLRNLMSRLGLASGLPNFGQGQKVGQPQPPLSAADQQVVNGWGALSSGWGSAGNGGGSSGGSNGAPSPSSGAAASTATKRVTADDVNGWGTSWTEDWDPEENLDEEAMNALADEAEEQLRKRGNNQTPRDKWITPLLDLKAVTGAVDPDQERTEDTLQGEALANKDESQRGIRYAIQLVTIPLLTGFIVSRALADPVLNFTLENNSEAFAMTDRQKIEGAEKVHIEEARVRFEMAIGKLPPLSEEAILEHLREYAEEVEEEERQANEQNLITVVSDSISSIMLFALISQQSRGRQALFNTLSRLFDGLSDIAKAVMIILIADTLLGYHSEEGWTGLIELIVGHYGFEAEEEALVIFVGVVPVVIDVFFKYWIFIGLNRISPGAVITLKQIDTH